MFKKLFLSTVALLVGCVAFAQMGENPVSWSSKVEKLSGNLYEIVLTGDISGDWHIYDLGPYTDGPIATSVVVAGKEVKAVGEAYLKTESHRAYDENFKMEIGTCESGVQVAQKVEVTGEAPVAKLTIEWQTCNNGACLPPTDEEITVKLPAAEGAVVAAAEEKAAPVKKEGGKSIWAVILEAIAWGL